jgi:hypothetical protein
MLVGWMNGMNCTPALLISCTESIFSSGKYVVVVFCFCFVNESLVFKLLLIKAGLSISLHVACSTPHEKVGDRQS